MINIRIGQGYDVHALVEGRDLWLCGVKVPHTHGLLGHSDADVAIHALCDALLGAAAMGDIGLHFSDSDSRYSGIDSTLLLAEVCRLLDKNGFRIGNVDVTIVAQAPKLRPYIDLMRARLAEVMNDASQFSNITIEDVSVKATTTERLGFEGRKEGISALAVCLIEKCH